MGETSKELLQKILPETCWKITAKFLIKFGILRGSKTVVPLLGKDEGIFAPVWGLEKFEEIVAKVQGEEGRRHYIYIKEKFNIKVEDAVGGVKFALVADPLAFGPEYRDEIVEATPERVVYRNTRCPWWERYDELEVNPERRPCIAGHQKFAGEGFKAINPKLTYKLTKARPWGDPYCEALIEFKEE